MSVADFNGDNKMDFVATAEDSTMRSNEFTGIVAYKYQAASKRAFKIKSVSTDGRNKATVTSYFKVNDDGTIGSLISTESK